MIEKETQPNIWTRLFSPENDKKFRWFDLLFGILWPITAIFIGPAFIHTEVGENQSFTFTGILMTVFVLGIWILTNQRLSRFYGIFAAIFLVGSLFALRMQLSLLRLLIFSVLTVFMSNWFGFANAFKAIGLIIVGGLPIVMAMIYLRNGILAIRLAKSQNSSLVYFILSFLIGTILLFAPSTYLQWRVSSFCAENIQVILDKDFIRPENSTIGPSAVENLKTNRRLCESFMDDVVREYADEEDPAQRQFLADIYFEILQINIEERLFFLTD